MSSIDTFAQGRQVVFVTSFEALLLRAYPQLPPPLVARLQALNVDPTKPFLPAYELATWVQVLHALTETLYPGVAYADALRQVGVKFVAGYFHTALGRAVLPLLTLMGPLRAFRRMTQNFRAGNNFTQTSLIEHSPTEVTLKMNHCTADHPAFTQGVLQEGLLLVKAPDSSVEVEATEGAGPVWYHARWSA